MDAMRIAKFSIVALFLVIVTNSSSFGGYPLLINEFSRGTIQWVEIYNPSSQDIVLDGWKILNSQGEDALKGSIGARGYLVIVASIEGFSELFPQLNRSLMIEMNDKTIGSGLDANADMLALLDPDGNISDLVNWGNPDMNWRHYFNQLWNPGIISHRDVIARFPNGVDTDSPTDFHGTSRPTPGSQNTETSGLDATTWGKIKALFSGNRRI